MSAYITNEKPSIFKVALHKLGLIELPIRVNCWYCNEDAYLLPGSKNTTRHWTCDLCENVNYRDDEGNVIDPSPIETNVQRTPTVYTANASSVVKRSNKNTVCDSCQDNLRMIQELLEEYLPDETDPDYKSKYENVDAYAADLHRRYDLCRDCKAKVNKLIEEQQEQFRKTKIETLFRISSTTKNPVRPKKSVFYIKGIFWSLIHLWTLFYVVYALLYMNRDVRINIVSFNVKHLKNSTVENLALYYKNSVIQCFPSREDLYDLDAIIAWIAKNQMQISILVNILSYTSIVWHPIQKKSYLDLEETKNWDTYKFVSHVLFFMRFAFVFLVNYDIISTPYIVALLLIYYIALIAAYTSVRNTLFQPLIKIGKSFSSHMVSGEDTTREPEINELPDTDDAMSIDGESIPVGHLDPIETIADGLRGMSFQL